MSVDPREDGGRPIIHRSIAPRRKPDNWRSMSEQEAERRIAELEDYRDHADNDDAPEGWEP